jgi:hypothetical protein
MNFKTLLLKTVITATLFTVIIWGCKKISIEPDVTNVTTVSGTVSLNEVKEWGKWYEQSIKGAPKLKLESFQTTILNNRFYMRVPLENSKGMIYFTKTNSLQAVFIRPNFKINSAGIKERTNTEFIDVNTNNYKVVTYKNNKPDSIYSFVFKNAKVSSEGMTTQGTFWFDLGCILSFGIPKWGDNGERECWGIDWGALGAWFASMFDDEDESGYRGGYGGGGGDGGLGDGGYPPGFGGNPSWPDPNNPGWGGGGGGGNNVDVIIDQNVPEYHDISENEPQVNLRSLFNCFTQIPDAGATYSVKLCVDLPVNGIWNAPFNLTTSPVILF